MGKFRGKCNGNAMRVEALFGDAQWIVGEEVPTLDSQFEWITKYQGSAGAGREFMLMLRYEFIVRFPPQHMWEQIHQPICNCVKSHGPSLHGPQIKLHTSSPSRRSLSKSAL